MPDGIIAIVPGGGGIGVSLLGPLSDSPLVIILIVEFRYNTVRIRDIARLLPSG